MTACHRHGKHVHFSATRTHGGASTDADDSVRVALTADHLVLLCSTAVHIVRWCSSDPQMSADWERFAPYFTKAFPHGMTRAECEKLIKNGMACSSSTVANLLRALGLSDEPIPCETFLRKVFLLRRVFMSCHQSELSHVQYTQLDDNCHKLIAKASTCSSNVSQTSIPLGVRSVNVPCYGSIPRALAEMMTDDMFANGFRRLGVERPSFRLDTCLPRKNMERVIHKCDIATTTLNVQETDKDAFARVKSFAEKFCRVGHLEGVHRFRMEQWVGQHVPDNFKDTCLSIVCSATLEVDDAIEAQVRAYEIREIKDGKEETNTLEQASLRWLGRALVGFLATKSLHRLGQPHLRHERHRTRAGHVRATHRARDSRFSPRDQEACRW